MDMIAILFGWPSLIGALLLSLTGVWYRKPGFVWIGALVTVPITLYLAAAPALPLVAIVPFAALIFAALTCRGTKRWQSWLGVGVYGAFCLTLAYVVIVQDASR